MVTIIFILFFCFLHCEWCPPRGLAVQARHDVMPLAKLNYFNSSVKRQDLRLNALEIVARQALTLNAMKCDKATSQVYSLTLIVLSSRLVWTQPNRSDQNIYPYSQSDSQRPHASLTQQVPGLDLFSACVSVPSWPPEPSGTQSWYSTWSLQSNPSVLGETTWFILLEWIITHLDLQVS